MSLTARWSRKTGAAGLKALEGMTMAALYFISIESGDLEAVRVATETSTDNAAQWFVSAAILDQPVTRDEATAAILWAKRLGLHCTAEEA